MNTQNKGLEGVVVADTKLSLVNGLEGKLIYLGYDIEQLVDFSFEDICHLFLFNTLPNQDQKASLKQNLAKRSSIPQEIKNYIIQNSINNHPMSTLRTAVSMLSNYIKEPDLTNEHEQKECALDLIAKTSTITAAISRIKQHKNIIEPQNNLSFSENFLNMTLEKTNDNFLIKSMDTALILHMDHGFNVSTFTARVVTSSLSDMISAVVAAISSLKGPLHGGANTAVMNMLIEIGSLNNLEAWLDKTLLEKRKIMGFGHRVYKTFDPRAKYLKQMSKEWGEKVNNTSWYEISERLEYLMLSKKGLNPNVDFYSASTYYSMGFSPEIYTPIFAVARMVGWCSHIIEQLKDNRIIRPKSNYIGEFNKTVLTFNKK